MRAGGPGDSTQVPPPRIMPRKRLRAAKQNRDKELRLIASKREPSVHGETYSDRDCGLRHHNVTMRDTSRLRRCRRGSLCETGGRPRQSRTTAGERAAGEEAVTQGMSAFCSRIIKIMQIVFTGAAKRKKKERKREREKQAEYSDGQGWEINARRCDADARP